jgi:hypothetical protein
MPELCRFSGIVIRMLFKDTTQHNKHSAWNKAVQSQPFDKIEPLR